MKKIIKTTLFAFACLFVLGLAACGDSTDQTTEYKGTMAELLNGSDVDAKYLEYKHANAEGKIDNEGSYYTITGLKDGYPLGLKLPETIDGTEVIAIESAAFALTDVVLVSIPGTVKVIGNNAFSSTNLKEINFAETDGKTALTKIGDKAFSSTDLSEVKLPGTVTSIGVELFGGCQKLTSVELPATMTSVPKKCFNNCSSLTNVVATGVTLIGAEAFRGTGLTEFVVNEGVKSIEKMAFAYCTKLTSVTLASTVENVKESAFDGCVKLASIELPVKTVSLGKYAFRNCTSLTSIKINGVVGTLGSAPFANCTAVTTLEYAASSKIEEFKVLFTNTSYTALPGENMVVTVK